MSAPDSAQPPPDAPPAVNAWLDDEDDWEWARACAEASPDWSDEQWRRINAALGYTVRSGRLPKAGRDPHV